MQRETESGPPGNSNRLLRKSTLELLAVSTVSTSLTIQRSVSTRSGPHVASFLWLSPHSGGVSNHVHCLKLYPLEKKVPLFHAWFTVGFSTLTLWTLGARSSFFIGTFLWSAAFPASTHQMPIAPPPHVIIKNVSRPSLMSSGSRGRGDGKTPL